MKKIFLAIAALLVLSCLTTFMLRAQERQPLRNAQAILAGGPEGLAPVSFPMFYTNKPRGSAYISSQEYPDLFVYAPRGFPEHTGIYLCEFDKTAEDGSPIYKKPYLIGHPFEKRLPPDDFRVFQDGSKVLGVWIDKGTLTLTEFDARKNAFIKKAETALEGIKGMISFDVYRTSKNRYEIVLLCSDGARYRPETFKGDTQSYYDGAGTYRGDIPRSGVFVLEVDSKTMKQTAPVRQVSSGMDVMISGSDIVYFRPGEGYPDGYIIASGQGSLKFMPRNGKGRAEHLRDVRGNVLTHPSHTATMASFPHRNGTCGAIIIGGEGAVYDYAFTGFTGTDAPVFTYPRVALQREAELYAGSLTVPNVIDWNGDGILDIVAGNSEGRLLFFENMGTDRVPDFAMPVEIESDGQPICFRPGHNIVQGPLEGAWGYLCPTVFDWNGDGLADVVFSGSRAKFEVMLNEGTPAEPRLGKPFTLRIDNMELWGTWRVRPAIAEINGRVAIVIMDDENALHLYWKVDDANVCDGGKLRLADGSQITGGNDNSESLGQWGRGKLQFTDWDGDGVLDILIGSVKRSSYPRPDRGLPWSRVKAGDPGMQVMLLRNCGTNEEMMFEEPVQFQIDGKDFYLGAHSNAPFACALGDTSAGPNLVVGVESGKFFFFERSRITTIGIPNDYDQFSTRSLTTDE